MYRWGEQYVAVGIGASQVLPVVSQAFEHPPNVSHEKRVAMLACKVALEAGVIVTG